MLLSLLHLYSVFIFLLFLIINPLSHFPCQITYTLLFFPLSIPLFYTGNDLITFLISAVTPRYILTFEDLKWEISNKREFLCFSSFWVWVTSFSIVFSISIHLSTLSSWFQLHYSWIVIRNIYVPHFHYTLVRWRAFQFFPFPSYCEWNGCEHS